MAEVIGIDSVKDVSLALIDMSAFVISELKKVQGKPTPEALMVAFADLMANSDLKDKVVKAFNEASQIPAEIKDFSAAEGLQLAMAVIPELVKVVGSL